MASATARLLSVHADLQKQLHLLVSHNEELTRCNLVKNAEVRQVREEQVTLEERAAKALIASGELVGLDEDLAALAVLEKKVMETEGKREEMLVKEDEERLLGMSTKGAEVRRECEDLNLALKTQQDEEIRRVAVLKEDFQHLLHTLGGQDNNDGHDHVHGAEKYVVQEEHKFKARAVEYRDNTVKLNKTLDTMKQRIKELNENVDKSREQLIELPVEQQQQHAVLSPVSYNRHHPLKTSSLHSSEQIGDYGKHLVVDEMEAALAEIENAYNIRKAEEDALLEAEKAFETKKKKLVPATKKPRNAAVAGPKKMVNKPTTSHLRKKMTDSVVTQPPVQPGLNVMSSAHGDEAEANSANNDELIWGFDAISAFRGCGGVLE